MLSPDSVPEHLPIQRQVRHDLLQARILVFDLLQPPHLVGRQARIFLLPALASRLADPGLPHISATDVSPLPCFRMNAFCASENFDAFMRLRSSPVRKKVAENSSFNRPVSGDQITLPLRTWRIELTRNLRACWFSAWNAYAPTPHPSGKPTQGVFHAARCPVPRQRSCRLCPCGTGGPCRRPVVRLP